MKKHKNTHLISILFSAPYLLLFLFFTVIPVIISVVLSFTNYNILEPASFKGIDNYLKLFLEDDVFMTAIRNTFLLAAVTGPVGYMMCLFVAWMLNEFGPKVRAVLTLVFYAPSISGAVYAIWAIIFSSDSYGIINNMLQNMGFINEPIQWLQNPKYILMVVMLAQIWISLGTSFLSFIAGLQGVDPTLYDAGAVDGIKNRIQELWYITIPSIRPQLMFGAVIQISTSFAISDICNTLAGFPSVDYSAHTIVTHMMDYGTTRFELGTACAIAVILFAIMVTFNQLINRLIKNAGK